MISSSRSTSRRGVPLSGDPSPLLVGDVELRAAIVESGGGAGEPHAESDDAEKSGADVARALRPPSGAEMGREGEREGEREACTLCGLAGAGALPRTRLFSCSSSSSSEPS